MAHQLLQLYLTNRKLFVNFGGFTSKCEKIDIGVIYINDLQNNINLKVFNFADDTLLYSTFSKTTYKKDITKLNS